ILDWGSRAYSSDWRAGAPGQLSARPPPELVGGGGVCGPAQRRACAADGAAPDRKMGGRRSRPARTEAPDLPRAPPRDARATDVTQRPVTVPDLFCTFCHVLGIDPRREVMTPVGRPIRVVDGGQPVRELFA